MAAHPHAELMALYAKDAAKTNKPWKHWEYFDPFDKKWIPVIRNPSWRPDIKYRRKPERPWYRVALLKTLTGKYYSYTSDQHFKNDVDYSETAIENHTNFVKWLTKRVYYDVE